MSEELKTYDFPVDHGDFTATVEQFYLKSEADKVIAELKTNLSEIQSKKMQLEDDVALLRRNNAELKKEIESMKVKFREFNDNVCKKIVDASRTMSTISQDAQMDFYEEFIKEAK